MCTVIMRKFSFVVTTQCVLFKCVASVVIACSFCFADILVRSTQLRLWMRTDDLSALRMTRAYVFGNGEHVYV